MKREHAVKHGQTWTLTLTLSPFHPPFFEKDEIDTQERNLETKETIDLFRMHLKVISLDQYVRIFLEDVTSFTNHSHHGQTCSENGGVSASHFCFYFLVSQLVAQKYLCPKLDFHIDFSIEGHSIGRL